MTGMLAFTETATEAMHCQILHHDSTVTALMGTTEGCAKSEAYSYAGVSSSIRRPRVDTGRAFNQAPFCRQLGGEHGTLHLEHPLVRLELKP